VTTDWLIAIAGAIGLLVGLAVGLTVAALRAAKLREQLAVKQAELRGVAALETEREEALALATERLTAVFGQLAHEQFRGHSETFLHLARETLSTSPGCTSGARSGRSRRLAYNFLRLCPKCQQLARSQRMLDCSSCILIEFWRKKTGPGSRIRPFARPSPRRSVDMPRPGPTSQPN
jgi:hypothetical protein